MIVIHNLGLAIRGRPVLKEINLTCNDGEIVGITGASGSGKSVLLKAMGGLLPPSSGSLHHNGVPLPRRSRDSARVVTHLDAIPPCNGDERLASYLLLARNSRRGPFRPFSDYDRQVTEEQILLLGLEPLKDTGVGALSGGAMKRARIARALIREPRALLLDNPECDLDIASVRMLEKALARYVMEGTRLAVVASNDLNFLSRTADRFVIMEDGAIAEIGDAGILTAETIKRYFGIDVIISKNIYSGKPEIQPFPGA
ncbi:MAG: ABC transporter ATP-binding protein [Spirochaetes bacterium]|nr:ABC transporter ATP-binding protein [Spirochaetota bacterium]